LALSETLISTILATSVTAAGLILAVYALLTPIFGKIVDSRRKLLADKKAEFDKRKEKIDSSSPTNEIRKLETLKNEMDEVGTFPRFFGDFVLLSFLFCTISFLFALTFSLAQIINPTDTAVYTASVFLMISLFLTGCYLFFGVGVYAIVQISKVLRQDWEILIEEKEEAKESTSEQLEKLRKDIEELKEREDRRVSG
jgi:F0F1-type ATP synthase membrane subunit b/b'